MGTCSPDGATVDVTDSTGSMVPASVACSCTVGVIDCSAVSATFTSEDPILSGTISVGGTGPFPDTNAANDPTVKVDPIIDITDDPDGPFIPGDFVDMNGTCASDGDSISIPNPDLTSFSPAGPLTCTCGSSVAGTFDCGDYTVVGGSPTSATFTATITDVDGDAASDTTEPEVFPTSAEFNCTSKVAALDPFFAGTGSTGSLSIPIVNPSAGSITINATGVGFVGTLTQTLVGTETTLDVPITYDGTGSGGEDIDIELDGIAGTCQGSAYVQSITDQAFSRTGGDYVEDGDAGICVKNTVSEVYCFGAGVPSGQSTTSIHGGATTPADNPPAVQQVFPAGVTPVEIYVNESFAFAFTSDDEVYSWGRAYNVTHGSLGRPGANTYNAPDEIILPGAAAGSKPIGLKGDNSESYLLLDSGQLYGFGNNLNGELGLGDKVRYETPDK